MLNISSFFFSLGKREHKSIFFAAISTFEKYTEEKLALALSPETLSIKSQPACDHQD